MSDGSLWVGDKVRLRAVRQDDWPYYVEFDEDSLGARNVSFINPPKSRETHKKETEELSTRTSECACFALAIENLDGGEMVGGISTSQCDARAGSFKYGLAVRSRSRRRGYGGDAARIILGYMFRERRFHKCTVEIYDFNSASIEFHEGLGFSHEGRLREQTFAHGRYCDVVVMGLIADEFLRTAAQTV